MANDSVDEYGHGFRKKFKKKEKRKRKKGITFATKKETLKKFIFLFPKIKFSFVS